MSQLIRRDAICTMAGGFAALLSGSQQADAKRSQNQNANPLAIVTGTLIPESTCERKVTGFIETGIAGGQPICSLVDQDPQNPMIMSVFAAPSQQQGRHGVEVTVCFFTKPTGHVTLNVLHVGTHLTNPQLS